MTTSNQTEGFINRANSILPFLPEEATSTKLTKDNSVTLELRSIPANVDSPKIKYSVRIVSGTETPREIIHWCNDLVNQVFPGLGLTEADSGPGQQAILKTVTTGKRLPIGNNDQRSTRYHKQARESHCGPRRPNKCGSHCYHGRRAQRSRQPD